MKNRTLIFRYFTVLLLLFSVVFTGNDAFCKGWRQVLPDKQTNSSGISDHNKKLEFPVKNIKPDWWESDGLIYFNIPARIEFKLEKTSPVSEKTIAQKAWEEFDKIGMIFNSFSPSSEVSRINSIDKSGRVKVSKDLFNVFKVSRDLWAQSSGDFDPTIFRIKKLWQNAEKTQLIPSEKDILNQLQDTGFDKVHLDQSGMSIQIDRPGIMFDFGGIVKGYAVDRVREILIHEGVTSGLVQLGGEVSTFADNNGKPWRIGIQHPVHLNDIWGVILAHNRFSVSTSGNYMQPIIISGQSFYHIFSPKTGKPVSEKVLGVTTASMNGSTSNVVLDGAATAITVLGIQPGLAFAKKLGIDVLILYEKNDNSLGEVHTPGFIYEKTESDNKKSPE